MRWRKAKHELTEFTLQVLVEGPSSDPKKVVPRHAAALSQISLANIVIPKIIFGVGHTALKKQWDAYEVDSKWENGAYAKNQAKFARRKELSDFERFKVMALRKQVCCYREWREMLCAGPESLPYSSR